ncbi:type III-A CRISPR-associated RAMP protein Csm4 [Tepidibacter formicigenes]|uniref:CRISPR system Cms protein Csm4 n=1 Tax=Tepidibacter formicigenes DSM 15518 TaxID=1123349 RepID=A0A1M6LLV4_9FIRM|nr:hypothetical protein [Tepidibacter formicigenes]SHJ72147.1 CRISPR type III-A/MTUBE-associated RAMP protein Csm4 [Tepidibacter formicigenes DSM 15518]
MKYTVYEWKINPKSSFLTKLHSDTIWGHIMWAIRYLDGENYLKSILNEFKNYNPPFIVSNGFLSNYLPFIKTSYINNADNNKLAKDSKAVKIKLTKLLKQIEDIEYVNIDVFNEIREGKKLKTIYKELVQNIRCPITMEKIEPNFKRKLELFFKSKEEYIKKYNIKQYSDLIKTVNVTKNRINRITNSSEQEYGSGVFNNIETFYNSTLSIYIKVRDDFDIDKLKKYLDYIQLTGFGKKASSGKGHFETVYFKERKDLFENNFSGNGFVILSNYIPKNGDFEGVISSNIITKRAKVSGLYSNRENVFKKPFVCYSPGSVFRGKADEIKGRMLSGLYYDDNVVQCMIPFTLGVKL